jgi:hypothetical protein
MQIIEIIIVRIINRELHKKYLVMQQVSKVILFLREGKFAARAQIRRVK